MKAIFVAGGTGGHINAALALGEQFKKNGHTVQYISGQRHLDYKLFESALHIAAVPLRYKNPVKIIVNLFKNLITGIKLLVFLLKNRPDFVLGAGGYVCGPVSLSAFMLGIPVYILEQNSVMGLTNRILSKISKRVFLHFENTKYLSNNKKSFIVGNPTRNLDIARNNVSEEKIRLLVFGGSLGAEQVNKFIQYVLENNSKYNLSIKLQTGKNKFDYLHDSLDIVEYIDDMSQAYSEADLIICRSGASTISELRIVQKPSFLIPFPYATDNHQVINAQNLKEEAKFPVEVFDLTSTVESNFETFINFVEEVLKGSYQILDIKNDACEKIEKIISEDVR